MQLESGVLYSVAPGDAYCKEVCLKREQVNNVPEIKGRGSHVETPVQASCKVEANPTDDSGKRLQKQLAQVTATG